MKFKVSHINNEKVKPIGVVKGKQTHPGTVLFSIRWPVITLVGKRNKGKTSCSFHILKKFVNKDTTIIVFCPTVFRDEAWKEITAWAEKQKAEIIKRTDFDLTPEEMAERDDGETNFLSGLVKCLIEEEEPDLRNYFFMFDDMSESLRVRIMRDLCKYSRHFHGVICISIHDWPDLYTSARKQSEYDLLFGGISDKRLALIHADGNLSIPLEKFIDMYHDVTKVPEEHNFLYLHTTNDLYRKNFSDAIHVDTTREPSRKRRKVSRN